MNDLYLSKIYQLLRPGCGGAAHHYPKSGANGMAMSCHMMAEVEPPLIAGAVSNPKSSIAALRATKDRRIAILALKKALQGIGFGNCAGLDADRFKRSRTRQECQPTVRPHLMWPSACQSRTR
jgi:flavin reductase (DIM6/NTAB) family NADH-FMN oxidoreductase RutF